MNDVKSEIKDYWNERSSTFDLSPGHIIANRKEENAWKSLLQEKIGGNDKKILFLISVLALVFSQSCLLKWDMKLSVLISQKR
jgi:hypothetical protein